MYLDQFAKEVEGVPAFTYYIQRDHNPQSGRTKKRVIWVPNEATRQVHERLKYYIAHELKQHISPYATACWKGRSHTRNALIHKSSRYFYLLDLESAYPSLTPEMATQVLCEIDPHLKHKKREVAAFLSRYCFLSPSMIQACEESEGCEIRSVIEQGGEIGKKMSGELGGLITGGPVSPWLFDLVAGQLIDQPIAKLLRQEIGPTGWIYSRYLDDITLSFPKHRIDKGWRLRRQIRQIIESTGFSLSHHKAMILDVTQGAIPITGLNIVHAQGRAYIKLSRSYLEKLRHNLYLANKPDSRISANKVSGWWGAFKPTIDGRITPLTSLEKDIVRLYRQFQRDHGKVKVKFSRQDLHRAIAASLRGKKRLT